MFKFIIFVIGVAVIAAGIFFESIKRSQYNREKQEYDYDNRYSNKEVEPFRAYKSAKTHIWGTIIGILLIVLAFSLKIVPTGHTGIVTVFGKVQEQTLSEGIAIMAPWKSVKNMDNRVQKMTIDTTSTTSDMQTVTVTFTLNYQISKANASQIYKTIGTDYQSTVISPQVANTVKSVMAQYEATELIAQRSDVAEAANEELATALAKYGIEVVDTAFENMDFTDEFDQAIEEKVVAEQNLEKAKTEQEKLNLETEQEAQRKIVEAQGTADANAILQNSYTDVILQKMFIEKWDGALPKVVGESDSVFDVSSFVGESEE